MRFRAGVCTGKKGVITVIDSAFHEEVVDLIEECFIFFGLVCHISR